MTDENTRLPSDSVVEADYLITKRGAYYRPNAQGYTTSALEAGRFTLQDAIEYSHPNGPDGPRDGIRYAHVDDVPALAAQLRDDVRELVDELRDPWLNNPTDSERGLIPDWCHSLLHRAATALTTQPAKPRDVVDLLRDARGYIDDLLDACEHSDGRNLIARIDTALSQTDEQPAIHAMTDAECATAYRDLRKRANDAGFATVGDWMDALAAQPRDDVRELLRAAYEQGATDVHNEWSDRPHEADFGEAASDYAASVALPQGDEQPAIHNMTDAECATAYRELRKRANDAGFATVGEWIDAQPDTQGTDGVAGERRVNVPEGQTPLDANLGHRYLAVFNEGIKARDEGTGSPYHGHSLEHCLHAAGWVQRDLRLALDKALAAPPRDDVRELLKEAIIDAATKWCGEKDRETFSDDIRYFEQNWRALPGLRQRALEAILARIDTTLSDTPSGDAVLSRTEGGA